MTTSSIRIGWVKAIWRPAMKVPIVRWAAMPTTIPMIPADAKMVVPSCLTFSKVISIIPNARTQTTIITIRFKTFNWVRIFLALRLSFSSILKRLITYSSKTYVVFTSSSETKPIKNRLKACFTPPRYSAVSTKGRIKRKTKSTTVHCKGR